MWIVYIHCFALSLSWCMYPHLGFSGPSALCYDDDDDDDDGDNEDDRIVPW